MSQNFAFPWKIVPPADFLEKNPHLKSLTRQLSLKFVQHHAVSEEDLKIVGSALWDGLGIDEEFQKVYEQAGSTILPLILSTKEPHSIISLKQQSQQEEK